MESTSIIPSSQRKKRLHDQIMQMIEAYNSELIQEGLSRSLKKVKLTEDPDDIMPIQEESDEIIMAKNKQKNAFTVLKEGSKVYCDIENFKKNNKISVK